MVRTRFAPSPTGHLHVGGARTALFAWVFAKQKKGKFVLRVEDTDSLRSTAESRNAILKSMDWLGLDYDEGPYFQSDRLERYQKVAEQLLLENQAYWCYATNQELAEMRTKQKSAGIKPRYDGRWRPENAAGKSPPFGIKPVLRFKNPDEGFVTWNDLVKGQISVANRELDDLIIMRADGTPTYNFGVVVDDWDMKISHVIRGDDHVNNTPRQINIINALDFATPEYGHLSMILGSDGERLSKRHGATSVLEFKEAGYLPEAVMNYLARLGWGFGDFEKFTIKEMKQNFSLEKVSKSPAKFDVEKLNWLNQSYIKEASSKYLSSMVVKKLTSTTGDSVKDGPDIHKVISLLKDRAKTINELALSAAFFYEYLTPSEEMAKQYYTNDIYPSIKLFREKIDHINWEKDALNIVFKESISHHQKKFAELAIPLRVMVTGVTKTPALNSTLEVLGRERVCQRIDEQLIRFRE